MTKLLFVCSGNICRSPLAHAMAEAWAPGLGLVAEVRSAGTLGLLDRPAAPKMVRVAREMGLDLAAHRSQALSVELVDWADRVLVMEQAHALEVRRIAPLAPIQAVSLLGPYAGVAEIDDPIGSWTLRPFRRTRQVVERAVRALLIEVAAQDSPHA